MSKIKIVILAVLFTLTLAVASLAFFSSMQIAAPRNNAQTTPQTAPEETCVVACPTLPPITDAPAGIAPLESTPAPDIESAQSIEPTPSALPAQSIEPTPSALPAQSIEPTPSALPEKTQKPEVESAQKDKPLAGLVIGVDPGHQAHSNNELEPLAPNSSDMKKKVSSGTQGVYTRIAEHTVNLEVGLRLQKLLKNAGATVVMTRTTADVNISNVERAKLFNKKKVDLGIRLHCNGSTDKGVTGAFMLVPRDKNYPYYEESVRAAKAILAAYGKATGIGVAKGITYRADQVGFNWCERPIVNIEMGHMTNKEEDIKLTDADFQDKMAKGIYNGIVAYFKD